MKGKIETEKIVAEKFARDTAVELSLTRISVMAHDSGNISLGVHEVQSVGRKSEWTFLRTDDNGNRVETCDIRIKYADGTATVNLFRTIRKDGE